MRKQLMKLVAGQLTASGLRPEASGTYRRDRGTVISELVWEAPTRFGGNRLMAAVAIADHYLDGEPQIAVTGFVHDDGLVWIDVSPPGPATVSAPDAVVAALPRALSQLAEFSRAEQLVPYFERGLRDGLSLPPAPPRRPPVFHLYLSLICESIGDRNAACVHASAWYERMKNSRQPGEPQRSLRQLAALACGG